MWGFGLFNIQQNIAVEQNYVFNILVFPENPSDCKRFPIKTNEATGLVRMQSEPWRCQKELKNYKGSKKNRN